MGAKGRMAGTGVTSVYRATCLNVPSAPSLAAPTAPSHRTGNDWVCANHSRVLVETEAAGFPPVSRLRTPRGEGSPLAPRWAHTRNVIGGGRGGAAQAAGRAQGLGCLLPPSHAAALKVWPGAAHRSPTPVPRLRAPRAARPPLPASVLGLSPGRRAPPGAQGLTGSRSGEMAPPPRSAPGAPPTVASAVDFGGDWRKKTERGREM